MFLVEKMGALQGEPRCGNKDTGRSTSGPGTERSLPPNIDTSYAWLSDSHEPKVLQQHTPSAYDWLVEIAGRSTAKTWVIFKCTSCRVPLERGYYWLAGCKTPHEPEKRICLKSKELPDKSAERPGMQVVPDDFSADLFF